MALKHKPGSHCELLYRNLSKVWHLPGMGGANLFTGEPVSSAYLRSFSCGCGLVAALGFPDVCKFNESGGLLDEQYTITDDDGTPLRGRPYRVRDGATVILSGKTDANGRTQRVYAENVKRLTLDVSAQDEGEG